MICSAGKWRQTLNLRLCDLKLVLFPWGWPGLCAVCMVLPFLHPFGPASSVQSLSSAQSYGHHLLGHRKTSHSIPSETKLGEAKGLPSL